MFGYPPDTSMTHAEQGSISGTFFHSDCLLPLFKQFHQVTLDETHDTFRFRVAHAYIVFNDHRFAFYINQAEEDKAFWSCLLPPVLLLWGGWYVLPLFSIHALSANRNRNTLPAHRCSAPFVAFADAFVVFCFRGTCSSFHGQNEYGTFYTAQNSSITTVAEKPNIPLSILSFFLWLLPGWAESVRFFPAQRPSAFSTYGFSQCFPEG